MSDIEQEGNITIMMGLMINYIIELQWKLNAIVYNVWYMTYDIGYDKFRIKIKKYKLDQVKIYNIRYKLLHLIYHL